MPYADGSLTVREAAFVETLTDPASPTFCHPSASYQAISPTILPTSANHGASRMSRNVHVQEAIRGQMGLGKLGSKLKHCLRESEVLTATVAEPSVKLSTIRERRETIMDYAKLTGQLIERREIQVISDERRAILRSLLPALPVSAPSLPSSLPASASRPPSLPSDASAA